MQLTTRSSAPRALAATAVLALSMSLAACGGEDGGDSETVGVALITKDSINP